MVVIQRREQDVDTCPGFFESGNNFHGMERLEDEAKLRGVVDPPRFAARSSLDPKRETQHVD